MCGPSKEMQQIAGQGQSFSTLLGSHYAERFGAQSQVLQNLNAMFTPIAQAGPDQMGFGPQELAALRTQAGTGVGQSYAKGLQALQTGLSARGGGGEVLPTGAEGALRGQLASAASQEMSQEELGITRAGYAQGRQNWAQATGGLQALSQEYNPNAIASETTGAQGQAFGEASQIQQMKNQKEQAIAGGITSLAMGGLGAFSSGMGNLDTTGSSSGGEQVGNFFKGALGFGG